MVGLDDFYNPMPENRFDVEVGRFSKDSDAGDLQDGGCEPEYSDDNMLQGVMDDKFL